MDQSKFIDQEEQVVIAKPKTFKTDEPVNPEQTPVVSPKSNKKLLILIIAAVGASILLLCLLLLIRPKGSQSNTNTNIQTSPSPKANTLPDETIESDFTKELDVVETEVKQSDPKILDIKPPLLDFDITI